MNIKKLGTIKKSRVDMDGAFNVSRQIVISRSDGAPTFSLRVFTLEANGHTPFHSHQFEHENYCISGEGAIVNEQGKLLPFRQGDFALVLPNEKHQYRNTSSDTPMVFICAVPVAHE